MITAEKVAGHEATELITYDDKIVKQFVLATLAWGAVAFTLGIFIASQLADWRLNLGIEWLTFGRLRPLHTNAAIFAFAGNAIFAAIYYSTPRLLKTPMFSPLLGKIHFWGWQLIIVSAAITLPLGITVSKEYAELEWPIDIAITAIWVVFAVNFFATLKQRREKHIYVAIWFYIATIVTVAMLHIVNSLAIPVSLFKSYSVFGGAQDALVQWWYGHNAVAFFLTTPFLGLMYYFLPKAANRPVYSYRLSIIHFWALIFMYIWAGPHHLLYTALPEWAQTAGMVFSVMLWAPSWGGMVNGLLTLRGAWDRVRTDPVLKFFVAGLTFYGMSTFEGPLLSIKSVSLLGHYTDWIIGHVHGGALGWNGFMTFGMVYFLVPRLWKTKPFDVKLANLHFWLGTLGILFYIISMWVSGITQGLMWRAVDETGRLVYPDFIETVVRIVPLYWVRALGGTMFLAGVIVMFVNVAKTIGTGDKNAQAETARVPKRLVAHEEKESFHRRIEGLPMIFTVLSILAVAVGSAVEIIPTMLAPKAFHGVGETARVKPYTPLELAGRDIYVEEGCYNCHSQMIRPVQAEFLRYGERSHAEESMYDHPFQWGSKRTGPDLARVGGKYPDLWHYRHMEDPRQVTPKSIMPSYPWLLEKKTDFASLEAKLKAMQAVGVPYSDDDAKTAVANAQAQAKDIAAGLEKQGVPAGMEDKEIVALIAYMQRLGTDWKTSQTADTEAGDQADKKEVN
jgi:cytochrome c oxidase cbb3-type subunit I/II